MDNDDVDTPTHISLHPKSCISSFVMGHHSQKGIAFSSSSWIVLIFKYKAKIFPSTMYYCTLHSSFSLFPSLSWYHHILQQEAVLQSPLEIYLLLGRIIHITTTVYFTECTIQQRGVHTVAKIWNKESTRGEVINIKQCVCYWIYKHAILHIVHYIEQVFLSYIALHPSQW